MKIDALISSNNIGIICITTSSRELELYFGEFWQQYTDRDIRSSD
jgi:hypothetical protein